MAMLRSLFSTGGATVSSGRWYRLAIAILFGVLALIPLDAYSLECAGGFVEIGDRRFEVESACGKPTLIQKWIEELVVFDRVEDDTLEQLRTSQKIDVEEWTYNFGPRRFLYFLRFDNGRVSRVESGPYGFDGPVRDPPPDASNCRRFVEPGLRMIDVLRYCGLPRDRNTSVDVRTLSLGSGESGILQKQKIRVSTEEWAYAFGPSRFVFFVLFENGRVTSVEDRDYGR